MTKITLSETDQRLENRMFDRLRAARGRGSFDGQLATEWESSERVRMMFSNRQSGFERWIRSELAVTK